MTPELEGQMPLFDPAGCDEPTLASLEPETCAGCLGCQPTAEPATPTPTEPADNSEAPS